MTGSETAVAGDGLVMGRVADVDGVPMSAIMRSVRRPRGVLVALHGGAASAAYFHYPGFPRLSLLETAAALDYTVIALDRPGYGASAPHANTMYTAQRRVELAFRAVDRLLGNDSRGAGLFLIAHSAGCELAVRMAAAAPAVLGIEIAGTGRRFHPAAEAVVAARREGPAPGLQELLWEPAELYPREVIGGAHFIARAPAYEGEVLSRWAPREFVVEAAQVRVPVRYTLGDHDAVWRNDETSMSDVAGLFTSAPRVETVTQTDSAHNLSLGLTARAYHLGVLSFVEECVAARQRKAHNRR